MVYQLYGTMESFILIMKTVVYVKSKVIFGVECCWCGGGILVIVAGITWDWGIPGRKGLAGLIFDGGLLSPCNLLPS